MERNAFIRGVGAGEDPDWGRRGKDQPVRTKVRGIVLAGCHSWGESDLERVISRPLLPVGSRPLICHALDWLRAGGIANCSICANSETLLYRRCLRDGDCLGIRLDYVEDVMPRGPAGCARDAALQSDDETFVVVEGAGIPRVDLNTLLAAHEESQAALTVVVDSAYSEGRSRGADVEPTGIYVFSAAALEAVADGGYQDIKEGLIPTLHQRGQKIVTVVAPADGPPRVTDGASYLAANMWATRQLVSEASRLTGHRKVGDAWIHSSANVHPTARFVGPVWVGPRTVIGPNAMIVGPTTIGADCHVCGHAVITRSAVWDSCCVEQGAMIDQCILTVEATVERDLVVRNTVCVSSQCPGERVLEWLASRCWLADDGNDAFCSVRRRTTMLAAS
jgi:NDP-sugar pyrophosphorylase family protein